MNLNINAIKQVTTRTLGRGLVLTQKYSPEILTTVGIVGTVTSAVLASKATLDLEPIIDSTKQGVEFARERRNDNGHTERDYIKDLTHVYYVNGKNLVKLYGPSVSLGVASIGCILGAHGIMRKRNVALAAAYKTIEQSFSEYRKRVAAELGEEREREFRFPTKEQEVRDEQTGEVKTEKIVDANLVSGYAKFFDEFNKNWKNNADLNLFFLRCQQNYMNDVLQAKGHVFLNEVYDQLGMERTKQGAVVGWVLGKEGDNFIDFGLYDGKREMVREFINGNEASILLDFNVDGVILDRI